jgi:hypothetical protein
MGRFYIFTREVTREPRREVDLKREGIKRKCKPERGSGGISEIQGRGMHVTAFSRPAVRTSVKPPALHVKDRASTAQTCSGFLLT